MNGIVSARRRAAAAMAGSVNWDSGSNTVKSRFGFPSVVSSGGGAGLTAAGEIAPPGAGLAAPDMLAPSNA
jgi:hypothetical protein